LAVGSFHPHIITLTDELSLHHLYRAMAWLGEELPRGPSGARHPIRGPHGQGRDRGSLFAHGRDLFTDLNVVFMDTTSLSFTGADGATLGTRGYSKGHRPDLKAGLVGRVGR
jgi:hypothetical protein